MLIQLLIQIVLSVLDVLFFWLPVADLLPLGSDQAFLTFFGYIRSFVERMWPLQIIYECFLYFAGFMLLMVVLKLFLGHRVPKHD